MVPSIGALQDWVTLTRNEHLLHHNHCHSWPLQNLSYSSRAQSYFAHAQDCTDFCIRDNRIIFCWCTPGNNVAWFLAPRKFTPTQHSTLKCEHVVLNLYSSSSSSSFQTLFVFLSAQHKQADILQSLDEANTHRFFSEHILLSNVIQCNYHHILPQLLLAERSALRFFWVNIVWQKIVIIIIAIIIIMLMEIVVVCWVMMLIIW